MNVTAEQLHADLDALGETAMRIKRERDRAFELLRSYVAGDYHDESVGLMAAFDRDVEDFLAEIGGAQ